MAPRPDLEVTQLKGSDSGTDELIDRVSQCRRRTPNLSFAPLAHNHLQPGTILSLAYPALGAQALYAAGRCRFPVQLFAGELK